MLCVRLSPPLGRCPDISSWLIVGNDEFKNADTHETSTLDLHNYIGCGGSVLVTIG